MLIKPRRDARRVIRICALTSLKCDHILEFRFMVGTPPEIRFSFGSLADLLKIIFEKIIMPRTRFSCLLFDPIGDGVQEVQAAQAVTERLKAIDERWKIF